MPDREKVIKGLECCMKWTGEPNTATCHCSDCSYTNMDILGQRCLIDLINDALTLLKGQEKEIKALRLLVEWAEECDFGFDQFPDEYERYKDEIKDMKYIDGMIHVAKRTLEDHGAFEEGR